MEQTITPELLNFIETCGITLTGSTINSPIHGSANKVLYKITTSENGNYWLKVYPEIKKFHQEHNAYKLLHKHHLTAQTPELLGFTSQPAAALLLTEYRGHSYSTLTCLPQQEAAFYQAGKFLHSLHTVPYTDNDSLTPYEALIRRFNALKKNNNRNKQLSTELILQVETRLAPLKSHQNLLTRSFCHRDFSPRNWIIANSDSVAIVDFEHALYDISLLDLTRLNAHYFQQYPPLKAAFFAGYQSHYNTDHLEIVLNALTLLYGLQTLTWGYKYNDIEFINLGKDALQIL